MQVLVTGGAGYIGSQVCKTLARAGMSPITLDNLSTGRRELVKWGPLVQLDLLDRGQLFEFIGDTEFAAVIHLASAVDVRESVQRPGFYYRQTVEASLNLVEAMVASDKVVPIIFSSTGAVYGEQGPGPLSEESPPSPICPYASGKWMVERILSDYWRRYGLPSVAFRYFNAAGADPEMETGECHLEPSHLFERVVQAFRTGSTVEVYGNDFKTRDGSGVRDYVHVDDIARAHLLGLTWVKEQPGFEIFNLGSGGGTTVLEVISAFSSALRRRVEVKVRPRQPGEPTALVASAEKVSKILGWRPKYEINDMVSHSWQWSQVWEAMQKSV